MDTISGLPAHPLLVHLPAVLLPLAVVGVVLMAMSSNLYRRLRWAVLAIAIIGVIGAVFAASSGAKLKEQLRREGRPITSNDHSTASAARRTPNWMVALLTVLAVGAGVASVITMVDAGHSGAKLVWQDDDSRAHATNGQTPDRFGKVVRQPSGQGDRSPVSTRHP